MLLIFIWIFLGFFALIVVGQLIPAVMLIIGLIKGLTVKAAVKSSVEPRSDSAVAKSSIA